MKKMTRILSVALVAVMVLSLAAVASAETPSVYIPGKLAKLVDAFVDDYEFPVLSISTTNLKQDGKKKRITEDSVTQLQFSEKPDWAGVNLSSLDGGWTNLDIDESGYAEVPVGELQRQPGMYTWNNNDLTYWSREAGGSVLRFRKHFVAWEGLEFNAGDLVPTTGLFFGWLYGNGGDYPYTAGKDYGDYNVTVKYHRDGSPYEVAVALKDVDVFETGMEGAVSTITFTLVNVELDSYAKLWGYFEVEDGEGNISEEFGYIRPNNKHIHENKDEETGEVLSVYYYGNTYDLWTLANTDVWYVSSVSAAYPEGNPIVAVEADYRNDAKSNLYGYKISYPVNETDIARITYKTNDTPIFGEYLKNGNVTAVSGSGNNINKWYKFNGSKENVDLVKEIKHTDAAGNVTYTYETHKVPKVNNNGKQVKTIKKGINSFKSPRVTTK